MVVALMNALLGGYRDNSSTMWIYALGMFLSNALLAWIALEIARISSRRAREKVEGAKRTAEAHH